VRWGRYLGGPNRNGGSEEVERAGGAAPQFGEGDVVAGGLICSVPGAAGVLDGPWWGRNGGELPRLPGPEQSRMQPVGRDSRTCQPRGEALSMPVAEPPSWLSRKHLRTTLADGNGPVVEVRSSPEPPDPRRARGGLATVAANASVTTAQRRPPRPR